MSAKVPPRLALPTSWDIVRPSACWNRDRPCGYCCRGWYRSHDRPGSAHHRPASQHRLPEYGDGPRIDAANKDSKTADDVRAAHRRKITALGAPRLDSRRGVEQIELSQSRMEPDQHVSGFNVSVSLTM